MKMLYSLKFIGGHSSNLVNTSKMAALEAAVRELGDICTKTEEKTLEIAFPEFTFDTEVCSLKSSVSDEGQVLTNRPQSWTPSQSGSKRCQFLGTCVTKPLPAESCFWQFRCVVTPGPRIEEMFFCDIGVVERKALFVDIGKWYVPGTERAFTIQLSPEKGHVTANIYQGEIRLATETLCPFTPDRPVEVTLGFLLDEAKRQLYVIEVSKPRVLRSTQVELSTPLFPAAAVEEEDFVGGEVRVELQSGEKLRLSRDLVQLLKSLLEKGNK